MTVSVPFSVLFSSSGGLGCSCPRTRDRDRDGRSVVVSFATFTRVE